MPSADNGRYDIVSRAFHWVTALAVLVAFILGPGGYGRLIRQGVDPATRAGIVWHESLGVTIFVLTSLRLLWLLVRPAPPRVPMPSWMRAASRAGHVALWALLFVLPVTALLALGSEGHPLTLLGGFRTEVLPWLQESALGKFADWGDVHGLLGDVLIWLAGLHAVAALWHHFVRKDGVLVAMLGWPRRASTRH